MQEVFYNSCSELPVFNQLFLKNVKFKITYIGADEFKFSKTLKNLLTTKNEFFAVSSKQLLAPF